MVKNNFDENKIALEEEKKINQLLKESNILDHRLNDLDNLENKISDLSQNSFIKLVKQIGMVSAMSFENKLKVLNEFNNRNLIELNKVSRFKTFNQWKSEGVSIKKGSKAYQVINIESQDDSKKYSMMNLFIEEDTNSQLINTFQLSTIDFQKVFKKNPREFIDSINNTKNNLSNLELDALKLSIANRINQYLNSDSRINLDNIERKIKLYLIDFKSDFTTIKMTFEKINEVINSKIYFLDEELKKNPQSIVKKIQQEQKGKHENGFKEIMEQQL